MFRFIFTLTLTTLVGACAQTPEAGKSLPITDITWQLIRVDGQEIAQVGTEPANLRLTHEGRAEGYGGCNRFFGQYRQTGDEIKFMPLASTRRACPTGMVEEDTFLKALGSVQNWQRQDGFLRLNDASGKLLLELKEKKP